jgi:hypothetical protein
MGKYMSLITVVSIFILLIVSGSLVSALTGSIGNARMVLYPEVDGVHEVTIDKSILVKNVNNVPILVTLVPDEAAEEFIDIIDNEFKLEPQSEKKAKFSVSVVDVGTYDGRINVMSSSLEENYDGPGVALSSNIVVIAKKAEGEIDIDEGDDDEDDKMEDERDEEDGVTGNVIDGSNSKGGGIGIFMYSTVVLVLVLIGLVYYNSKKSSNDSKKEGKRNVNRKEK